MRKPLTLILAMTFGAIAPAHAWDGAAGPYLAGRLASLESDYVAASDYYMRALAADPGNVTLMENAMISLIGRGQVEKTLPIAAAMEKSGVESQIADLATLADLARREDFAGGIAALDAGRSAGPLVDGLYRAWAMLGQGQMSEAVGEFDKVGSSAGLQSFGLYHKALALASVGDFEGADAIFEADGSAPLHATRRGVLAHAQVLSQLERNPEAIALIDGTFPSDPVLIDLRARLDTGETAAFTVVDGPLDGIVEVFQSVASALGAQNSDINTLAYARVAEYLAPDEAGPLLLCAAILEEQGQYDLATEAYNRIPRTDPAFLAAELGRAETLKAAGRTDAAIEVLEQLAKQDAGRTEVWITLGDTFRREERFAEAATAYDKAIATFTQEDAAQWPVYYTRGISNERQKNWPAAESDFRMALKLMPDQPAVLNYLGYSYLERKENFDEALTMIERAVALRPDDGAIVDSLGWALYLMGRYPEAVSQLEQAVQLMPLDSVVNDHLGDVYWAVDRRREAEFQWKRALSFDPIDEAEAERIRRKLEVGLDVVLKEEGASPLAVTKNGG